ncbi:MAG: preprotein translocase subunit YajC [Firmicutes bacterium HGW-Firmicutes-14]|nr:MAG: preprotein translocase subunit YajC [Firmicutes bacterium HGW-Firmicutes-14]
MDNYVTIIYFAVLLGIFYFLIIRPQQQRQKKHQQTINSLEPNQKITTIGGIMGTVVRVKDETITLKIAENVKIEVLKSSVASINEDTN